MVKTLKTSIVDGKNFLKDMKRYFNGSNYVLFENVIEDGKIKVKKILEEFYA